MTITFLTVEDVITLYEQAIIRYGGDQGIRDHGLLESAYALSPDEFWEEFEQYRYCETADGCMCKRYKYHSYITLISILFFITNRHRFSSNYV